MLSYHLGQESAPNEPSDLVIELLPVSDTPPVTKSPWWVIALGVAGIIAIPIAVRAALRD